MKTDSSYLNILDAEKKVLTLNSPIPLEQLEDPCNLKIAIISLACPWHAFSFCPFSSLDECDDVMRTLGFGFTISPSF